MIIMGNDRPNQDEIDAFAQVVAPASSAPPANGGTPPDLASIAVRLQEIDNSLTGLTASVLALTTLPARTQVPDDPSASMSNQGQELGNVNRPGGLTNGSGQPGTTSTGTVTPPALSKHQGPDPIAGTGYMTTDATLNQDGVLYATTTTRSVQDLKGFTGGVFAIVADRNGNVLARTALRQFGVNGLWIPGGPSTRVDPWSENLGVAAAANGATLNIVHVWDPHGRLFTAIPAILNDVVTLIGMVEAFCKQEPMICSAVATALGLAAMA